MKTSHVHTKPRLVRGAGAAQGHSQSSLAEQGPWGRGAQLRSPLLSSCPRQALRTHSPAAAVLRRHVLLLRAGGGGRHQHPLSFSLLAGQSGAALLGRSPGTLIRLEWAAPAVGGAVVYTTQEQSPPWEGRDRAALRRAVPVKPTSHKSQHLP